MFIIGLSVFTIIIFVFALLINGFLLKYLREMGTQTNPDGIRWNQQKKPAIGGLTFFICFLLSTISLIYTIPHSGNFNYEQFYGIMLAVSFGFLAGFFDDAYNTIPWVKLLMQIVCGLALALTGTNIILFDNMFLNYLLTVFWVVGIMNAVNLIDNMDGIATIVVFFIIMSFIALIIASGSITDHYFLIFTGVAATLLAFLKYNWWPSKMYMGDTGSMFLGVFIAAFGIVYLWNAKSLNEIALMPVSARILSVAVVFVLPLTDTTTVFIKRLFFQRKSPFIGGKDHTTHHISYLGLSDRNVAIVFIILAFLNTCAGLAIFLLSHNWKNAYMFLFGGWILLQFITLFVIANMNTVRK